MADMKRPIEAQIAEVKRELSLRANVYPARVAKAAMTQAEADEHTARMEAVLETLQRVERKLNAARDAALKETGAT